MLAKKILYVSIYSGIIFNVNAENLENKKSPNLLYIFPDQYRLFALGIWSNPEYREYLSTKGDPVHTPNLDRLAKQGVLFNQVCSTFPVSSPHRGMLMSGMYPRQNGIEMNCHIGREYELKQDIKCFTDVLAEVGYETAYVGKTHWHKTEALFDKNFNYVGTDKEPGGKVLHPFETYIPEGKSRHSIKYWFQTIGGHFKSYTYSNQPDLVNGKKDGEVCIHNGFTASHEADIVIKYLRNNNGEREKNKPFSLIWSINPPHPPYRNISDCEVDVYNKYYKDMPTSELLVRKNVKSTWKNSNGKDVNIELNAKVYFSLIKSVDEEIGRVLNVLDEIGEADNTVVVFSSDHGEMMGSHCKMEKGCIYDEAFLVPFIIRYPGVLKHKVDNIMMGTVDIMPTLLGIMGLGDKIPSTVEGKDYSDGIMTGVYGNNPKPESAVFLTNVSKGVRTGKYTYVVNPDGTYSLYNNITDPYQMNSLDLNAIPSEDMKYLKKTLGDWLKTANDRWCDNKVNQSLIDY